MYRFDLLWLFDLIQNDLELVSDVELNRNGDTLEYREIYIITLLSATHDFDLHEYLCNNTTEYIDVKATDRINELMNSRNFRDAKRQAKLMLEPWLDDFFTLDIDLEEGYGYISE